MLPGLLARMMRRGNYRHKFWQRFGRYDAAVTQRLRAHTRTWIHSISVGETFLALKLARKMKELEPGLHAVISVTTSTGLALAEEQAADWMEVIYNPLDALSFVRRALDAVRPARLIFIEAIWPNLLAETTRRGAPVAFIPRLSPRSERRFRKARKWTGPIFREITLLLVSDAEDVPRWTALGADASQIRVVGNIKFDQAAQAPERLSELREILRKLGIADDAPILLAGSTFPGEERIIADTYARLRQRHRGLFLIIVPRHIERTNEIAAELTSAGLSFALRSAGGAHPADCLLVNTTGELRDWYRLSTVVFIGKSLTSTGGQNPVEAVAAGKPVIFGPHMENFQPLVAQWLAADAAIEVARPEDLGPKISELLNDPARCAALVSRARDIVARHEGATLRAAEALRAL